ncbi:hypothetical protein T36_2280 (plasmid) [Helicobacter cinaedi]|uniref:hypothetical protein n=1 Tax=Helicobacter TaxID=209 RepID=UPI001F32DB1D|nr:hypothetical protein [Helicobacter cinaedi]BDB65801.1 hypothetical protein T36_2280 [Helicobacter cinaedi]
MAEDKAKDDKFFNTQEKHEIDYVAKQYPQEDREKIKQLLKNGECGEYQTHEKIYKCLQKKGFIKSKK